jgi:hypothetical protein
MRFISGSHRISEEENLVKLAHRLLCLVALALITAISAIATSSPTAMGCNQVRGSPTRVTDALNLKTPAARPDANNSDVTNIAAAIDLFSAMETSECTLTSLRSPTDRDRDEPIASNHYSPLRTNITDQLADSATRFEAVSPFT